jgi:hypothetical protein
VSTPPKESRTPPAAAPEPDDVYGVGQIVGQRPAPAAVERHVQAAERAAGRRMVSAADEPPPPSRWPMLTGIIGFPWRLSVLGAWMLVSVGLMVAAWLVMFWWGPGAILGTMSARLFGPPALTALVLTFGYAATCCLTIVERTSQGWDRFEVSPDFDWKEWTWNFGRVMALLLQAGMVGAALQWLDPSGSWAGMALGTFVAFPLVLLGALASGEAWFPLAIKTVLWSMGPLWWAWGLFYVETAVLTWGWMILALAGLHEAPWATPLWAAPLLAAVIFLYARLLGRLAGCIVRETAKRQDE